MGRERRDNAAGTFHVFTHCVWPARGYFVDDDDRAQFLRETVRAIERFGWTCVAYCLLETHYHLLLVVADGALSKGMQSLNWRYAMYFNSRHELRGHVQFEAFGSRRVNDEGDLLGVFRYIAWNPVEAGLCRKPQDWAWSSYAGTVGLAEPSSFVDASLVLACFPGPHERAIERLREHVEGPR